MVFVYSAIYRLTSVNTGTRIFASSSLVFSPTSLLIIGSRFFTTIVEGISIALSALLIRAASSPIVNTMNGMVGNNSLPSSGRIESGLSISGIIILPRIPVVAGISPSNI